MNKDFDLLHVHIVGFSGQPTLRNPASVAESLGKYLKKMEIPGRRLMAVSPLTGTTDLVFAKEALDLKIPLVVVLMAPREELRKTFPAEAANEFDQVLEKAARTETLLMSPQLDAAARVGQKLVDEADVLLIVSDETDTPENHDVAEVMAYASRRGRPVICFREKADGIAVHEIRTQPDLAESQLSIDELEKILGTPPPDPVIPTALLKYFHACDSLATSNAPKVRRYVLDVVLANAIASMAGSVASSFPHHAVVGTILTVIKFGGIFLGLGIFAVLKHRQSKSHWLALRLNAEVCRSAVATWNSPVGVEPLTADEVPELRHLIQALRYFHATQQEAHADIPLEAFKAGYGRKRLADQYRYFQRQANSAGQMATRLSPIYWILSVSAFVVSGISLFLPSNFWSHDVPGRLMNYLFIMVPIMAPAMASWIIAWQAIESVSRKKARFVEMKRLMHQALVDLIHCHSWEAVHHVVKRTERQLLGEVLEWYSFVKYS
jgi:hypothetical protein